jgi:hypothetical protein
MPGDVCVQYLSSSIVESPGQIRFTNIIIRNLRDNMGIIRLTTSSSSSSSSELKFLRERERGEKGELG